jgi:mono/diheme cytochrome c family protein
MPSLWASEPAARRAEIAEALVHFLVASSPALKSEPVAAKAEVGRELFHSIGCIACHSPRDEKGRETITTGVVHLDHLARKYPLQALARFLHQPQQIRPAGRMPDLKLTDAESAAIARYLIETAVATDEEDAKLNEPSAFTPQADRIAEGRRLFEQYHCAACHGPAGNPGPANHLGGTDNQQRTETSTSRNQEEPRPTSAATSSAKPKADQRLAPPLAESRVDQGCLAAAPTHSVPWFDLGATQRQAIVTAIEASRPGGSKPAGAQQAMEPKSIQQQQLARTLTAFNCLACHVREEFGGVAEERNSYFQSPAKNLGDDARIPPPLTLVGAKLQPVWLKKVLFDGESVRPHMITRMPQYGETNLRHLPELLADLDQLPEWTPSLPNHESRDEPERNRARDLRDAGRKLLGNTSLNCVNCHNYNGKTPQNNGLELMTTPQRLKPAWFRQFLLSPNTVRPRIIMPVAWPGGQAVDQSVLKGDTDQQLEAIWYFLTLGRSAPDPAGVQPQDSKLMVTDTTRTYRGRSGVAGYRGIAVGFPEQLNYAFNAETGALSAIWRGDFVRVDRGGQGSGGFNPAARPLTWAQDVAFYRLPDDQTPWPLRPVMNKDQRVNPDPLYPKNRGYQFGGYYLDDQSIPTFLYQSADVKIEDKLSVLKDTKPSGSPNKNTEDRAAERTENDAREMANQLQRVITFNSSAEQTIWFRPLTGKIEETSAHQVRLGEMQLTHPVEKSLVTRRLLRALENEDGQRELLLQLKVPAGQSQLTLLYELLK